MDGKVHLLYTAAGELEKDFKMQLGHAVSSDGFNFRRLCRLKRNSTGSMPFLCFKQESGICLHI